MCGGCLAAAPYKQLACTQPTDVRCQARARASMAAPAAAVSAMPMHTAMAMVPPSDPPMRDRPQQKAAAEDWRRKSTHSRPRMPNLGGQGVP